MTIVENNCRKILNRFLRTKVVLVIFITVIFIYTCLPEKKVISYKLVQNKEVAYILNTSRCRIPLNDPYNEDIIKYLKYESYYSCSKYQLLSYIEKKDGEVTLNINQSLLHDYSYLPVSCCYKNITRINFEGPKDNDIRLSNCTPFRNKVKLTYPYIQVECNNFYRNVYTNVHAATIPLPKRTKSTPNEPKFSVLLLGIDSISKSSLRRTMPKTEKYAENNFNNLIGYNKIGENTFPNLMAILTGQDLDQLKVVCNDSVKLNTCHFIWDKFRDSGYITAYSEDACSINTFHYDRPGFLDEPTDFYYRPYFLAAEKLKVTERGNMVYCIGPETSGERLFNSAKDFALTFKEVPSFGLFWANSFSHDDINMPSVMDEYLYNFLSDREFIDALNNTILIFLSDHGFRFGDIRYTFSGWLEERLPFIYFRFPESFKSIYPNKFKNFLTNSNRLTVPYDLFNTLQEILEIGNSSYEKTYSKACPQCLSLFSEVPENRSCEDAKIDQHWCTCKGVAYIDINDPSVGAVAEYIVDEVNKIIANLPQGDLCSVYSVHTVRYAGCSEPYINNQNRTVKYYVLMVETSPKAIFEATVEAAFLKNNSKFKLLGNIGRIDYYKPVTWCVENGPVKKYCYCAKNSIFSHIKDLFF